MTRSLAFGFALALAAGTALIGAAPAQAQSVGYVTGIPGPDPARDDEIGWGPAYRPETSFAQPGTPPTPGQLAARGYYERTGRPVYDPPFTGSVDGYYEEPAPYYAPRRVIRQDRVVRRPAKARRYTETRRQRQDWR